MHHVQLTLYQRRRLQQITRSEDRFSARKAIALLELDNKSSMSKVSASLGITTRTLRNWIVDFQKSDLRVALKDQRSRHSGRPRKWNLRCQKHFEKALKVQPDQLGYQAVVWTVGLLSFHLQEKAGIKISSTSLRRRLHEQKYVWKRPRYQLLTDPQKRKKNQRTQVLVPSPQRKKCRFIRG
ncbi:MAG: helix-turn-helix domain-containing protein [Pseudobdellovibrionaceae bacterium]